MGTYLSTPVLDKHVEKGDDLEDSTPCRWAVVDMQGWRKSMEDAHVARTDVPLPCCSSGPGNDDDGGGGEGKISNAKVFAVFDGHGGAEVARFCQVSLVPVLTSQEAWKNMSIASNKESTVATDSNDADGNNDDDEADAMEKEEAEEEFDHINPEAKSLGKALIDSFHALDRLIDDPNSRGEIDRWRTERPPPYVSGGEEAKEEDEGQTDSSETENTDGTELQPIEKGEDVQERRHTAMDQNELADSVAKLQEVLAAADDDDDDEKEEKAVDCDTNDSSETDSDELENKAADGTVNDDSDDDEKVEVSNANENDDGEIVDTTDSDEEEKGTVTLSSSDAVALFQKLLHLNVTDEDDDSDEDDEDEGNAKLNGYSEGENQDSQEVVIPTKEQLLNPPTGIVAPSASVPTKIQNGRKVCNLPDHPVHAGCTSIVAVIVGRTLVVANAGDSRGVICRKGGLAEPLSFDHKPLQKREMTRITNSGGFVNQFGRVNGNLNLSRSIGDLKYKQVPGIPPSEQMITAEPDILSTTIGEEDEFIILGCDGIWDCLTNEECVKYVYDRIDTKLPHEIGMEMLDEIVSADPRASQGIGGDNMTIMIIDLLPHTRSCGGKS
ncbi:hypothetical protein ACHAWC_005104 [Mediolabrus comicus]